MKLYLSRSTTGRIGPRGYGDAYSPNRMPCAEQQGDHEIHQPEPGHIQLCVHCSDRIRAELARSSEELHRGRAEDDQHDVVQRHQLQIHPQTPRRPAQHQYCSTPCRQRHPQDEREEPRTASRSRKNNSSKKADSDYHVHEGDHEESWAPSARQDQDFHEDNRSSCRDHSRDEPPQRRRLASQPRTPRRGQQRLFGPYLETNRMNHLRQSPLREPRWSEPLPAPSEKLFALENPSQRGRESNTSPLPHTTLNSLHLVNVMNENFNSCGEDADPVNNSCGEDAGHVPEHSLSYRRSMGPIMHAALHGRE
ncbi:unnamed protein product [Amoebophrya sp. A25]|nr:unnamed protein product [Amoebophrya sp. A25]|eukprot:GSA25T00024169001.1